MTTEASFSIDGYSKAFSKALSACPRAKMTDLKLLSPRGSRNSKAVAFEMYRDANEKLSPGIIFYISLLQAEFSMYVSCMQWR